MAGVGLRHSKKAGRQGREGARPLFRVLLSVTRHILRRTGAQKDSPHKEVFPPPPASPRQVGAPRPLMEPSPRSPNVPPTK
jgi:hypothetical protein